ncbi:leucine-rich repeat extensin-like protein 6 [Mizuhopecten yessoensis]|uniref:Uncharacterized protein n=1 Tax=Mizuhopecten yessoensis TaxID=6573 RepID=A0A210PZQ0_MIZYE|nr:leucine-rich repeat extensin-like protein 6 [Mizuhopecten yessoensis]OWF41955.1 hypothetical protein KP79_PYT10992 [Mizuhopecten yessoensis]
MNSFLTVAVIAALFGGLQANSVFTRSGESSMESIEAEKVLENLCEKIRLLKGFIPSCIETASCTNDPVLNGKLDVFIGEIANWYEENCDGPPPGSPPPSTPPPPPAKRPGGQSPPPGPTPPPPTPPSKRELKLQRLLQNLLKSIQ